MISKNLTIEELKKIPPTTRLINNMKLVDEVIRKIKEREEMMMIEERVKAAIKESMNIGKYYIIKNCHPLNLIIFMHSGKQDFERDEIMEHIEDEFNIKIEDHVFDRLETVQDIIDLVKDYESERTKNVV